MAWGTRSTIGGAIATLVFLAMSVMTMRTLIIKPSENVVYNVCNVEHVYKCSAQGTLEKCMIVTFSFPLMNIGARNGTIPTDAICDYSKCTKVNPVGVFYISCYFDSIANDISLRSYGFPVFGIWLFAFTCVLMLSTGFGTIIFCLIPPRIIRPFWEKSNLVRDLENESLLKEDDQNL
jgi:hypothetical protein